MTTPGGAITDCFVPLNVYFRGTTRVPSLWPSCLSSSALQTHSMYFHLPLQSCLPAAMDPVSISQMVHISKLQMQSSLLSLQHPQHHARARLRHTCKGFQFLFLPGK